MAKGMIAAFAVLLAMGAVLSPPAAAVRVRTRHHDSHQSDVKIDIKSLPDTDFKGLTSADALTVTWSSTPLLPAAAQGGKPLSQLKKGMHLKKLGAQNGFYHVQTATGQKGYVSRFAVAIGKVHLGAKPASGGFIVVKAAKCNVYSLPMTEARVITTLPAKTKIKLLDIQATFYKVNLPSNRWGYVEKAAATVIAK